MADLSCANIARSDGSFAALKESLPSPEKARKKGV
jgi:hypothetical protein